MATGAYIPAGAATVARSAAEVATAAAYSGG